MSDNPVQNVLNELFPYFERLETQSAAVLQLLEEKGIVSKDELDRYLGQASKSSDIKWRAARVRMERLMTPSAASDGSKSDSQESRSIEPSRSAAQETPENLAKQPSSSGSATEQPEPTAESRPDQGASVPQEEANSSLDEIEAKSSAGGANEKAAESADTPAAGMEGSQGKSAA